MTRLKILLLTISLTSPVFGQQNKLDIGIEGGPSLTSIRGNKMFKKYNHPTLGYSGGLSFQFNFPKKFSVRTGFAYERKGSVHTIPFTDAYGNTTVQGKNYSNFDYLVFPVLLHATLGKSMKFFVNSGLFFSYLLKQTFTWQSSYFPKQTGDNTSNDKRFDTGLALGLGFSTPIKDKFSITCEIRNNLGLYNVSAIPVFENGTIKTNSTNLLCGFAYKLGTRMTETK